MRKTFFICTLFICFLFVACSSEKQKVSYDSFISDMTNDGVIQKAEKEWWIGKYEFNNLAEQKRKSRNTFSQRYASRLRHPSGT